METLTPLELYKQRRFGVHAGPNDYNLKPGYYEIKHEDGEIENLFIDFDGSGTYLNADEVAGHMQEHAFLFRQDEFLDDLDAHEYAQYDPYEEALNWGDDWGFI